MSATTLDGVRRPEPDGSPRDTAVVARGDHFRPDIEGLRAVAVALVFADHVFGWPAGGFIGVDVFFVISGFLITSLLVRERARTGQISFRGFYARRARRLFPAAFLTLAVTTAAAWFVFLGGRFRETVTDVVWAALFSANINFARQGTDYFEATAAPSLVQHFWSLAVEEQFYLVWPGLILLAFALPLIGTRRRRVMLWAVLGTVTAASFAWSVHATSASPVTAYFSTFTRAWELGLGAMIAISAPQLHRVPAALRAVLAWCGLGLVVAAALLIDERTPFPGTAAALPVVGAALLVAWGSTPGGPGTRWLLSSAPAGFLGAISYSLYLWHWPVLILAGALVLPGSAVFYAGVVVVSLVLATFSYYCVEQPVLHTNWLLSHRPVDPARARRAFVRARTVGLATAAAVAVTVGALVVVPAGDDGDAQAAAVQAAADAEQAAADQGLPPLTPLQRDIQAATFATEWPADLDPGLDELPDYLGTTWAGNCLHISESNVDECRWGPADAEQSVAVLGDSFAAAWLPALRQELVPAGWSLQSLTFGLCPNITSMTLFEGQPFQGCVEHREWAIEHILETRPTMVVLTHSWRAQLSRESDRPALYTEGLTAVVRRIQASGAEVVLLGAPPGSESLQTCPTSLNGPDDCLRGPADTFAPQMASEQQVAAATGARAIDPEAWFCIDGRCPTFVGTAPVYGDGQHLTQEYAERIAPEVVAAILQP
ncbi:acyltransferase family protein [Candidatus Blastococcus massiliensis]|uniref:acyltransferase family protein n=1 Tax=Candidatus Blastococcus massiliensis TaxID=1470358 RepID=UPI001412A91E|nr:acyltransferase family protein [Candidatus Blastococcus massiliensis]